jgi:hypothetical protein
MEDAFNVRGDLSSWSPEVLDAIDACFTANYLESNGDPSPFLFFPDNVNNLNQFTAYCTAVDHALRSHANSAPKHACEYFAYYSVWQMRNFRFPVPLGTKSVVGALNGIATSLRNGFIEVRRSCHDAPLLSDERLLPFAFRSYPGSPPWCPGPPP